MRIFVPAPILDDAFITAQVARNLAIGEGMVHNSGERVFTVTTVVWTLLNAALRALGIDSIIALRILGLLSEIALAILMTLLGYRLLGDKYAGVFATLLLLSASGFVVSSFGGMETALSLVFISTAFLFLAKNKPSLALIISAISIWVRIDNLILVAIIGLFVIFDREYRIPLKKYLLPLGIILLYLVGAYLYFGSPVPVSVLRKSEFANDSWAIGAASIAVQFFKTAVGRAEPMFYRDSAHWLILIPLAVGVYTSVKSKMRRLLPVAVFSVFYIALWISTGRLYALLFNWYFVPPMIGIYLLSGLGMIRIMTILPREGLRNALWIGVILVSAVVGVVHSKSVMTELLESTHARREKTYTAITVFLNERLHENSTICAGEIGAVKFYARRDIEVLDWVGLTRPLSDRRAPKNLIDEERPEAIIYWPFPWQTFEQIAGLYTDYSFGNINGIMLGVRNDIADEMLENSIRLVELFNSVALNRENPVLPAIK